MAFTAQTVNSCISFQYTWTISWCLQVLFYKIKFSIAISWLIFWTYFQKRKPKICCQFTKGEGLGWRSYHKCLTAHTQIYAEQYMWWVAEQFVIFFHCYVITSFIFRNGIGYQSGRILGWWCLQTKHWQGWAEFY